MKPDDTTPPPTPTAAVDYEQDLDILIEKLNYPNSQVLKLLDMMGKEISDAEDFERRAIRVIELGVLFELSQETTFKIIEAMRVDPAWTYSTEQMLARLNFFRKYYAERPEYFEQMQNIL